ncbi:DUF5074 domain-containing protein [Marinoscillum sp.]|uniref:DUF5074 domain-containing protein n=1 Tax=Marinoscillum sp. TaxID=2024838 RepID=UPI003BAAC9A2
MRTFFQSLLVTAVVSIVISCSNGAPEPQVIGQFDGGIFVSNEGNFGEGDGSLSFINASGNVTNQVFKEANGYPLGDVVQSVHIDDDLLFMVVNNSNKIEVASLEDSLYSQYSIEDLSLPRYMTSHNGLGYVTEWVSFTEKGRVSIFDLETGSIQSSIEVGFGPEGLILADDYLYVSNNFSTNVSVIDLDMGEVINTIEVGNAPSQMALDAEGHLWVACQGGYDDNYAPLGDGKLVELDASTGDVLSSVELQVNFNGKIDVSPVGDKLFFTTGNELKSINTDGAGTAELIHQFESVTSFYGLAVSKGGAVYLADAGNFTENGKVYVILGDILLSYSVGRGPNGFAFN